MVNELKTRLKSDTFNVVDQPNSQESIKSRFFLTHKYSEDDSFFLKIKLGIN